ncbi:MAG: DUF1232 domain-containing protein [Desulfuromonadaceae bacterium]|nr:DUF1232 domain-containing protein [Desulfuromonadaceae bacterium]
MRRSPRFRASGSRRGRRSSPSTGRPQNGRGLMQAPLSLLRLLVEKFLLAKELLLDPATPWHVKLIMVATGLYLLSPFDFIPDMIPILGITDDLALLALSWSYCQRFTTDAMWQRVEATLQRWD